MKRYIPLVGLLGCAAVLTFGIVRLFELRFDMGDVYPAYSSLRSDPLGTMALYESLERLPGLRVQRDFSTSNRLPDGAETTYLHIAASRAGWTSLPEALFMEVEQFVAGGGRFVITMVAEPASTFALPELAREPKTTTLREQWGIDFRIVDPPLFADKRSDLPLPESLEWHSPIVLTTLNEAWTPIYVRGDEPVIVERQFGRGSIVFATDSYLLSNEAMRQNRQASLLAWLVGSGRNVIFDEAHLGVTERPGVATLMRKYRLEWLIAAVILLAGLFVWKNSVSLVPYGSNDAARSYVAGKDAAAGFDNLLRRSIPKRDLLAVCFAEWKKTAANTAQYAGSRMHQAEEAFQAENARPEKDRDAVRAYRTISRILRTHIR
jgi:hypothetical protein